jgi:lipoprotein-anchoring transpeptidase ErfK/SrfK
MPSITLNIRLVLLTFMLLCATALLSIAQQFIANAAELSPSSALFDPTAQVAFDPVAALMSGDLFSADDVDIANVDTLNVDSTSPAGTTGPSGGPIDSTSIAATATLTETLAQNTSAAPAGHVYPDPGWPRTTAETALAAPAANPPTSGKWIDINLTTETVTAYSGTMPIKTVLTSTGTRSHPTVVGTFHVWAKVPSQTMRGGSWRHHDRYSVPGVPNILYFYQGYSLHGTYWHRNFGHPMSHGCANLTLDDAAWFYDWTPLGTTVRTHFG